MFLGPLVAIFIFSKPVFLTAIFFAIIITYVICKFDKKLRSLYTQANNTQSNFFSAVSDCISNIRTIIALSIQKNTYNKIDRKVEDAYTILKKNIQYNQLKWIIISLLLFSMEISVVLCYLLYQLYNNNLILVGSIVILFQYMQRLTKMFWDVATCYQDLVRMQTDYSSIQAITEEYNRSMQLVQYDLHIKWKQVCLENVMFSYTGRPYKEIKCKHFEFCKGAKIALIGDNGSGKSTLLNILCGTILPNNLDCYIDGTKHGNCKSLNGILIPQDSEMFEDTILYNITMEKYYDIAIIEEMMAISMIDNKVSSLPNKLDSSVNERGVNLSGGKNRCYV
jgi:ABC-type bacteriocin/lantibiotic exporter with double-glycine peptidase domain